MEEMELDTTVNEKELGIWYVTKKVKMIARLSLWKYCVVYQFYCCVFI